MEWIESNRGVFVIPFRLSMLKRGWYYNTLPLRLQGQSRHKMHKNIMTRNNL